jgi:uncharacterized coiled-coil DUF342 family protein
MRFEARFPSMATLAPHLYKEDEENRQDEDQLLKLFWNRAELKKELNELREESLSLHETLKEQQSKTVQAQQRLEQLEVALGDPEQAMTAVAYYRLRAIWEYCHSRLKSMGMELARAQHEQAERLHVAGFRRKVGAVLEKIENELKLATAQGEELSAQIDNLCEQRSARKSLWNYFRRRSLTAEIERCTAERNVIRISIGKLAEKMHVGKGEEPPEFAGLDVAARRKINIAVIAYAQELFLHFADRELAKQLKEASVWQLLDARYGSPRDCRVLWKYADDRMALLQADAKLRDRVQFRAGKLQAEVVYRNEGDTVPEAVTLSLIPLYKANGRQRGDIEMNVLGEEYWDIFPALLS